MVGEKPDTVNTGKFSLKQAVCMTVILGLSQISYNWTIRVSCKRSHPHGIGEQRMHIAHVTQYPVNDMSLPLYKLLHSWSIHTIMDVWLDTKQLAFLSVTSGVLHDGTGSTGNHPFSYKGEVLKDTEQKNFHKGIHTQSSKNTGSSMLHVW
jgi:hypothetical protein